MRKLILLCLVVACGKKSTTAAVFEMPTLSSALTRAAPSAPAADVTTLAENNTDFAQALSAKIAGGNFVFSPFSISLALAMTEAGAGSSTETAMLAALQVTLSDAALHPAFNALCASVGVSPETGTAQVQIANTLVVDKTMQVNQPFLDTLALNYGAKVRTADFIHAATQATSDINTWVSDRTNGKINPLFASPLDTSTRLVVVNAIYLDALWAQPFLANDTSAQTFTTSSGTVSAPTMAQVGSFASAATIDYTAVALPYANSSLALLVVMPSGDLATYAQTLDHTAWAGIVSSLQTSETALSLPKFQIAGDSIDLVAPLTTLGMGSAFGAGADFSRMTAEAVTIAHVTHRAFIRVDEAGTEAAAATAVGVTATAAPVVNTQVHIDHPFVFALRDTATGTILFQGQVLDPTK